MFLVQRIVLVCTHGEAKFSVHAQHVAELEITPLVLVCTRLADTDEAAALIDKTAEGTDHFLVFPVLGAAP